MRILFNITVLSLCILGSNMSRAAADCVSGTVSETGELGEMTADPACISAPAGGSCKWERSPNQQNDCAAQKDGVRCLDYFSCVPVVGDAPARGCVITPSSGGTGEGKCRNKVCSGVGTPTGTCAARK